ncbi:MAG: TPM domain-containing protein [Firmicutes bacterium]|nr:TPM domain-containing protein [Candidatus Fermentithermobacillaceae bacterium]
MLNLTFHGTATGLFRKKGARPAGIVVLVLAIILLADSPAYQEAFYPDPKGNINDYVGVLTQSDIDNLNALADAVLEQTGVTFAVAIVSGHGDESLELYGVKLYEKWGIGQEGEDKGLLVLVSMEERELRMEVGYGLEPVITDGRAGECLDIMIPYFKNGEYGRGLYEGLLNAAYYIAEDAGVELVITTPEGYKPAVPEDRVPIQRGIPLKAALLLAMVALFPVAVLAYLGIKRRRCPRCRSRLVVADKVIQEATASIGGLAVRTYRCPVCGYSNEKKYRTRPIVQSDSGTFTGGPGPFFGGLGGRGSRRSGSLGPRGFGGGRSGGGGASRRW